MSLPTVNKVLTFNSRAGDLQVSSQEIQPLQPKELLVNVYAASINPVDTQLWRSGLVAIVAGDKGMGRDFSGTVVAVGKSVTGWKEGDDIFGLCFHVFGQGTLSQYITINPASDPVFKKPDCLSHEAAASMPVAVLTAFSSLDWLPPRGDSQRRVIVRGASGGTGSWLVQVAKILHGCHVTAICSGGNAEYVKSLGADEVIDYTTQSVKQVLLTKRASNQEGSDLVADCVGGIELLSAYPKILHKKGAYITIVGDKTDVKALGGPATYVTTPAQVFRYVKGLLLGPRYACVSYYTDAGLLQQVVGLAERGEAKTEIQEVVNAFNGHAQG